MIEKAKKFVSDVVVEMKKVSWPSVNELRGSTMVVIVTVITSTVVCIESPVTLWFDRTRFSILIGMPRQESSSRWVSHRWRPPAAGPGCVTCSCFSWLNLPMPPAYQHCTRLWTFFASHVSRAWRFVPKDKRHNPATDLSTVQRKSHVQIVSKDVVSIVA